MSPEPRPVLPPSLAGELADLPALPLLRRIWSVLPRARLVGGAVRDLLDGQPVHDFDFGTPEAPAQVLARLEAAGIRAIGTGLAHGTVTAVIARHNIEITTLRRDERTDGRHAEVVWTEDWREDAARRDFTINAMSCDADGAVHDYFGGADDLRAGRVRFVGDARTRIEEDALRLLRFFRFQARYGRVPPEPALLATISGCLGMIDRLSAERIWSELRRILAGPTLIPTLALMGRAGVLAACLPALSGRETAALSLLRCLPAEETGDPLLRLAALMAGAGLDPASVETTLTRLRVSRVEDRTVRAYLEPLPRSLASDSLASTSPASDAPTVRRLLSGTERQILMGRTWLEQARSPQGADWPALRGLIADLPVPVFPLAGRDLLQAGLPPGPRLGEILAATRAWWEQNGCDPDQNGCMAFALSLWIPPSLS